MSLFQDGFENGFTPWGTQTNSTHTITTETMSPAFRNGANMKAQATAAGVSGAFAFCRWANTEQNQSLYARAYMSINAVPVGDGGTNGIRIIAFSDVSGGATVLASFGWAMSGGVKWFIRYRTGGVFYDAFGTSSPQLNTPYLVEARITRGAGNGSVALYVDGILEVPEVTGLTNDDRALNFVMFGHISTAPYTLTQNIIVRADDAEIGVPGGPTDNYINVTISPSTAAAAEVWILDATDNVYTAPPGIGWVKTKNKLIVAGHDYWVWANPTVTV